MSDSLVIAGRPFQSRLIVGTGKYRSFQETARALEASGADMVTVAVRRVNLDRSKESLLDFIDSKKYFLLPNTAGCYTADEAIRAARLAREVGLSDWVKLEVIGDQATLYPDVQATLEASSSRSALWTQVPPPSCRSALPSAAAWEFRTRPASAFCAN
jgi:thiazole synthase